LYNNFGYKTSATLFENQLDDENMSEEQMNQLATSYRLIHDTENAEIWYAKFIDLTEDTKNYLHYAQVLQSNGKNELAKEYFLKYDKISGSSDKRGELLASAINRMNEFQRTDIEIKNEEALNSKKLEFSPTYYDDGIVFVSTRDILEGSLNKDIWLDDNFMSLFFAKKNSDGTIQSPEEFSYHLNTRYHEGPVAFTKRGDQVIFTRNNFNNGVKIKSNEGVIRLKIFTAQKTGEDWGDAVEMPFNTNEYDECHPALSSDRQAIIFASNREGGYGGMDLYISKFVEDTWEEPINLGPNINTAGNEAFPFVHDDGTLYFASDGWGGLGGLDIFSTLTDEGGNWAEAVNIGAPINSKKDDFGFILNVLGTEGYFSSARNGNDDIYSFKAGSDMIKKPMISGLITSICAFEDGTENRISEVDLSILERNQTDGTVLGNADNTFTTNANGEIIYNMEPDKEYVIVAKKEGFKTSEKVFSTEGMTNESISFCVPMTELKSVSIKGVTTNMRDNSRIANATITITDLCTNKTRTIVTDILGEFTIPNVDCTCEWIVKADKNNYFSAADKIVIENNKCENGGVKNVVFRLASINQGVIDNAIASSDDNFGNSTDNSTGVTSTELGVGSTLELENIYYDFDDYKIREGAGLTLDELAAVMRVYPSMKIELIVHTDARGKKEYNQKLSERRAKYAVKYLIEKGIKYERLKYKGSGESRLRNHCQDGVECTEEEHQFNRRTMITVTAFDNKDVDVKYLNNPPEIIDRFKSK